MPTYDYSCRSCGARFEVWQKMSDEPLTVCPTCGSDIHRIVYPVGLVFKGSGFYSTDNRRSGSNGSNGSAGTSASETPGSTTEGKAETAAEAKSEAKPEAAATKAAASE